MTKTPPPVLELCNLEISLPKGADRPYALEGLDLIIEPGEIVCLVGESGSGKSMTGRAILRLIRKPGIVEADHIKLDGVDLLGKIDDESVL